MDASSDAFHNIRNEVERVRARARARDRERRQSMNTEQREARLARRRQNYRARRARLTNEQRQTVQSGAVTPLTSRSGHTNPNASHELQDSISFHAPTGCTVGSSHVTPLLHNPFSSNALPTNEFEGSSSRGCTLIRENAPGVVGSSHLTALHHNPFTSNAVPTNQFEGSSSRGRTSARESCEPNDHVSDESENSTSDEDQQRPARISRHHNIARNFIESPGVQQLRLPNRAKCRFCRAILFHKEKNSFCCKKGRVILPAIPVPYELYELFTADSPEGRLFRKHIRPLNHVFSFTSIGVELDLSVATGQGVHAYRAHGAIYHKIGTLLPPPGKRPRFVQMFIFDTEHEIENRLRESGGLRAELIDKIKRILDAHNPFVKTFRQLAQRPDIINCKLRIKERPAAERQYVLPTASQVAAIVTGGEELVDDSHRDIIVQTIGGQLMNVKEFSGYYDPMQYPLFFPYGSYGWDPGCLTIHNKKVTCCDYYAYMLQIRRTNDDPSILLHGGRLFQQYVVDNYVKIETQKLRYIRNNQDKIRAELYQGLQDCLESGETEARNVGKRVVLPSSFVGSPRDMYQRYQDAMAIVKKFGRPYIFLTMTCNPNWIEIQEQLYPGQTAQDRPDLLTRIFRAKYENMKKDVYKHGVLGRVVAHVHVIEYQKRGLPHVHLVVILHEDDKLNTPDDYDKIVRAEIPDRDEEPQLYEAVLKHMIHGPCGVRNPNSPCMKNGSCKKNFPKQFADTTIKGTDSYPIYRRRNRNRFIALDFEGDKVVDDRDVVPYNPWLLLKYDCHINVEICSSIKSIKYLYKYVYKGPDCVVLQLSPWPTNDEINQYVNGRWICAPEALWKMYKFPMSRIYPSVVRLQLHLPNRQQVRYYSEQNISNVLGDARNSRTMLTEFFQVYAEDRENAKYLYSEFPGYYRWISKDRVWQRRKSSQQVIGRIYAASPHEGERFYLRALLNHIRGPKSFDDLMTVNGERYLTFRQAAEKFGILEEDDSIRQCLIEARVVRMPSALRRLFATILIYCEPTGVRRLWDENYSYMIEDYHFSTNTNNLFVQNRLLHDINVILQHHKRSLSEFDLPQISHQFQDMGIIPSLIEDELNISICAADLEAKNKLNFSQTFAFDTISNAIQRKESALFFVDGPGGTGKTFLYRALLAYFRSSGLIMLATATSGIASTQLPGGRTAHSKLKIPIKLDPEARCNFSKQSEICQLFKRATAIIWDEAPMANRKAIEVVDITLREMLEVDLPFGGLIVIFGGDFRQVVPVVVRGTRSQSIQASIVESYLWSSVKLLRLTENIRAHDDRIFADFLIRVGNGEEPTIDEDMIRIPESMVMPWEGEQSIDDLISWTFPGLGSHQHDGDYMMHRAIITPRNDEVNALNEKIISSFQSEDEVTYYSFDSIQDDHRNLFLPEFLNSLSPGNLPPHKLTLKKGCPIMLLRNIDPRIGLCNGTRLICHRFGRNVIDAEILTGEFKGTRVFLPRIPLKTSEDANLPFEMTRRQFPVRLSFALTINKSQGQTIPYVGIYLPEHVFSHGQLYVAFSRGVSQAQTKVLVKKGKIHGHDATYTRNVVYPEIFTKLQSNNN